MLGSEVQTYLGHEDLQHDPFVFLFQVKFGVFFTKAMKQTKHIYCCRLRISVIIVDCN